MQLRSQFFESINQQQEGANSFTLSGKQPSLKSMIMRLKTTLGSEDLVQSIVLVSKPHKTASRENLDTHTIGFVVGYSGSAHSQSALDLALLMAHQTRLAKPNPVLVHVVHVIDQLQSQTVEAADRILWQARCLASEWQSPVNAHLRIGQVATALTQVATEVQAEVLLLGCQTANHVLVQRLAAQTPCSVLGLPQ